MTEKIEKQGIDLNNKTILVMGAAGFIGHSLVLRLLKELKGSTIVGIDSLTDYNPIELKMWRLDQIKKATKESDSTQVWVKGDIADKGLLEYLFETYKFNVVVNLAAQAGVRYSIDHPDIYIYKFQFNWLL